MCFGRSPFEFKNYSIIALILIFFAVDIHLNAQDTDDNNDGSIAAGYLGATNASVIVNLGVVSDTDPGVTYGVPLSTLANTPNIQDIGTSQDVNDDSACCDVAAPSLSPN